MQTHGIDTALLENVEREPVKKKGALKRALVAIAALVAVSGIAAIIIIGSLNSASAVEEFSKDELPNCQTHPTMSCSGASGPMDSKWESHLWNTPPRNADGWKKGYQDMNTLQGYAEQKYAAGLNKCTVTIVTKTAKDLSLTYSFNGQVQTSASKDFDNSFKDILKVKVIAASGETLELDDIDFIWNSEPIKSRNGDYRNGQKGAVVELFGWPDEDIEKECKTIAEAGYLGVKVFPHNEQIMSAQPYENEMNPWYFMYQPVSYRLQGRMGTRDQFRKMIKTCRSYGLRVYADAVVNHMSGGGNDAQYHRINNGGCTYWYPKTSSANETQSPYYTPQYTYQYNARGETNNVLEYPGVPYGPMDFHCESSLNAWTDPNNLNAGWLVGLADLDTSKDYVRQRIADYFVDLLSIGVSGFRVDAAKHIHPKDLAAIFAKFKDSMGGSLPSDFFTWLEVLSGGESSLLLGDSEYSYTTYFANQMKALNLNDSEIEKIKIWWSGYPVEPGNDGGRISMKRKVIQNDDHDQQNSGSSSRDMHDQGSVLVKDLDPAKHRSFEVKLFNSPYGVSDNNNDYPIRMVLSSYYFSKVNGATVMSIPDGKSDCGLCNYTCSGCRSRSYTPAYVENAVAYAGSDYTRVHRDAEIIKAMRSWMKIN